MAFDKAVGVLRFRAGQMDEDSRKAQELLDAADALETLETDGYHDLTRNKDDLPDPGERVIICMGYAFTGEGYLKEDGKWYRYCDFGPVEQYMSVKVVGWKKMPRPMRKPGEKRGTRISEAQNAQEPGENTESP